jgi:hypothetical protein
MGLLFRVPLPILCAGASRRDWPKLSAENGSEKWKSAFTS